MGPSQSYSFKLVAALTAQHPTTNLNPSCNSRVQLCPAARKNIVDVHQNERARKKSLAIALAFVTTSEPSTMKFLPRLPPQYPIQPAMTIHLPQGRHHWNLDQIVLTGLWMLTRLTTSESHHDLQVAAVSPELQQDLDPGLSSSSDDSISEEADSESDDGSNPLGDLSYREFDEYVPHLDLATGQIETKFHGTCHAYVNATYCYANKSNQA